MVLFNSKFANLGMFFTQFELNYFFRNFFEFVFSTFCNINDYI